MDASEKLSRGFAEDDEIVMEAPPFSDSESEELPDLCAGGTAMEALLEALSRGEAQSYAPELLKESFWSLLSGDELTVGACAESPRPVSPHSSEQAKPLRRSLDDRGHFHSQDPLTTEDALSKLRAMMHRFKAQGFAPAFIWVYDESWELLRNCWQVGASVLTAGTEQELDSLEQAMLARMRHIVAHTFEFGLHELHRCTVVAANA